MFNIFHTISPFENCDPTSVIKKEFNLLVTAHNMTKNSFDFKFYNNAV